MEDEDLIREKMEDTRTAMTEKLETLEQKVVDTVEEATSAVTETVATVKDSIQDTVTTVSDTVQGTVTAVKDTMEEGVDALKGLFDVPGHVQRYPWPMVAGSLVLGYAMGKFLGKDEPTPALPAKESETRKVTRPVASTHGSNGGRREHAAPKKPGLLDEFGPELAQLKGLAIGALMGAIREMALQAVPQHMGDKVKGILDNVTEKLGGAPMPASETPAGTAAHVPEPRRPSGTAAWRMSDPAY